MNDALCRNVVVSLNYQREIDIPPTLYLLWLGHAYRLSGQYENAIGVYEKLLQRSPNNRFAHIWLTATYSTLGHEEETHQQAEKALELDPTFSLKQYTGILPIKDKAQIERLIADLR